MSRLSKRNQVGTHGKRPFAGMSKMQPNAAGLDIGAHEIVGCVPGEEENTQEVQTFGTYTSDLVAIGDWFRAKGITSVAMESTGVSGGSDYPAGARLTGSAIDWRVFWAIPRPGCLNLEEINSHRCNSSGRAK